MARHKNFRNQKWLDDEDDYGDVYGHSVEDGFCCSPSTTARFMYPGNAAHDLGGFIPSVHEAAESELQHSPESLEDPWDQDSPLADSGHSLRAALSSADRARLDECLDQVRGVLDKPEGEMIRAAICCNFDANATMDCLLPREDAQQTAISSGALKGASRGEPLQSVASRPSTKETVSAEHFGKVAISSEPYGKEAVIPESYGKEAVCATVEHGSSGEPEPGHRQLENVKGKLQVRSRSSTPKRGGEAVDREVSSSATPTRHERKRKDMEEIRREIARSESGKPLINLVVIGHVDAGKSTLLGHLLYSLGQVSKRQMHKYETESQKLGKASFAFAWVLDETEEERARGVTMDVAQTRFETDRRVVNLLDAPGHKDFIPNMITGAAQADCAVLVINATRGEFESGFDFGGQTREHAMLARSLGIQQLVVAVNKMDTVGWAQSRYKEIVEKLRTFLLKSAQFKESDLRFVPCSGLGGENLLSGQKLPAAASWYSGESLVHLIDTFRPPERAFEAPLRLCVSDVFRGQGTGVTLAGKVETGLVCAGDKLLVNPSGETATVKSITVDGAPVQLALAGHQPLLTVSGLDPSAAGPGSVLCDLEKPVPVSNSFRARLVVLDTPVPVTRGFPVVLHMQSLTEPAVVRRLLTQQTKSEVKKKPKCLPKHSQGTVEIRLSKNICLETYKECRALGRFMLRDAGRTVAAGMVEQVLDAKDGV